MSSAVADPQPPVKRDDPAAPPARRRDPHAWLQFALPLLVAAVFLFAWDAAVRISASEVFPRPLDVARGIRELVQKGLLVKYIVASLFRVTWGFGLAVLVGRAVRSVPGLVRARLPGIQSHDPDFPPDLAHRLDSRGDSLVRHYRYRADLPQLPGQRFSHHRLRHCGGAKHAAGLSARRAELRAHPAAALQSRHLPSCLPQIITGIRIALGVAWLVVVAAEMIAVNSGLGYLIIDARNAGKRYDLVVAGMVMIGLIGLVLESARAPAGNLRRSALGICEPMRGELRTLNFEL